MKHIIIVLKGMSMGIADIIPGVSGGTIALILGIYEKLLESISRINLQTLKMLKTHGLRKTVEYINGSFLICLFSGILTSIILLSKLITFLMDSYPIHIWGFFFGLILSSIIILVKKIKRWKSINLISLVIFTIGSYIITILEPTTAPDSLIYIFLSGFVAIIAMILPGISGSFILLLMGSYYYVLNLVNNLSSNFSHSIIGLSIFCVGCVLGITFFSRILTVLFNKYHDLTMSALIGIMVGTLNKIWPWQEIITTRIDSKGKVVPLMTQSILPDFNNPQDYIFSAIMIMAFGVFVVVFINRFNRKK